MMKRLFFNAIALMVLVSPLLMATQCKFGDPPDPEDEVGCEIDCEVWVKYVDENGQRIKFEDGEFFKPWRLIRVGCVDWIDLQTQSSLDPHAGWHNYFPHPSSYPDSGHSWMLAAPARDSLTHPKVKAKLRTSLLFSNNGSYVSEYLYDDIEVELNYTTPDKASIDLIKINGEVKWDRSKASKEELSKAISIDIYLDKDRLKEFM